MDPIHSLALSLGVAWASGINLYAAVFMLGYLGMTGNIELPADLVMLSDPLVMSAAGLMIWLWPKLWRGLGKVFCVLGRLFGKHPAPANTPSAIDLDTIQFSEDPKLGSNLNKDAP